VVGSVFASTAYQFFPYLLLGYTTALFSIARNTVSHSTESKSVILENPDSETFEDTTEFELARHFS